MLGVTRAGRRKTCGPSKVPVPGLLEPVLAAVVIWKACSAIAHGDLRGTVDYLSREALGQDSPGVVLNGVTANVQLAEHTAA